MLNMASLADWLAPDAQSPVDALIVYNSNPAAIAPDSARVTAALSRDDLFTVVLEHFQTDTADYADVLLPATMQFEHLDLHKSYGHRYVLANLPAVKAPGECLPNTEIFRRLAARMGFDEDAFRDDDDTIARQLLATDAPTMAGIDWDTLKQTGWQKLALPEPHAPFAHGGFRTRSGKCEFYSAALAEQGHDPLPTYRAPPGANADTGQLTLISPPARNFLNSSFANIDSLRQREGEPSIHLHPEDAERRGIASGMRVRVFNTRGEVALRATIDELARPGVAVAPSIWWRKLSADGKSINELTDTTLTDLGAGPTFYDCRVNVSPANL
jgi:anaerobic selenocysteine-containing dehydrogenase